MRDGNHHKPRRLCPGGETPLCRLGNGGNRGNRRRSGGDGRSVVHIDIVVDFTVGVLLGAVARDVTSLAALIAGLASSVKGTAVGGGAVSGDVAELAASVALHSLGLAITSEVVRTTALVAGGRSGSTGEATSAEAEAATAHGGTTAHVDAGSVGAGALMHVLKNMDHTCKRE